MLLHAPAKLNLFLEITGQLDNGYHTLLTLSAFTQFGDEIEISESDKPHFEITGEFAAEVSTENNIISKTLALCGDGKNYSVTLKKNIPVSAGLGGGSSDAAAIVRYFISDEEIAETFCKNLGADVFMCYLGKPALLGGIGDEVLRFAELPPYHVVLVNPRIPLATKEVFEKYTAPEPRTPNPEKRNDLTETAIKIVPEIGVLLESLADTGAVMFRMSGSGATCFALFEDETAAEKCKNELQSRFPRYWIQQTRLK